MRSAAQPVTGDNWAFQCVDAVDVVGGGQPAFEGASSKAEGADGEFDEWSGWWPGGRAPAPPGRQGQAVADSRGAGERKADTLRRKKELTAEEEFPWRNVGSTSIRLCQRRARRRTLAGCAEAFWTVKSRTFFGKLLEPASRPPGIREQPSSSRHRQSATDSNEASPAPAGTAGPQELKAQQASPTGGAEGRRARTLSRLWAVPLAVLEWVRCSCARSLRPGIRARGSSSAFASAVPSRGAGAAGRRWGRRGAG